MNEPTDKEFIEAMYGYCICLNDGQEARMSRKNLERLIKLAQTQNKD